VPAFVPGDFRIVFNYDRIQWETGDASGGSNGFGGSSARVGYSNGSAQPGTFFELMGSGTNGILLDSGALSLIASRIPASDLSLPLGRYEFVVRNGAVDDILDPTGSGPPPASDSLTEPVVLSNPRPSGCTFSEVEITCPEIAGTPSFILFDTNIPGDARFLQFEFSFEGTDVQALGTESLDAPVMSAGDPGQRTNSGDLGAVFISNGPIENVPIAVLPGSSALPGGVFLSSGQFPLSTSGPTTVTVTNFSSGAPGSVFRIRNLRIDRCAQTCFGQRPTICGTNSRDVLRGTPGRDVIVGRGGNDRIEGRGGNDRICGGTGNDRLSGGKGKDRLSGDKGRDVLLGGAGRDTLVGGLGRDTCDDGSGEDSARSCDK
jgi:Ca2+-binding RTX toxin-like protein